ncbi:hypothetical protein ACTFIW_012686 [Dictyostelium discoideum]
MDIYKFNNIEYLNEERSNQVQKNAYKILKENKIIEVLKEFEPILAGTIPIEIDIIGSDLDICCCWKDDDDNNKEKLISTIEKNFSSYKDFKIKKNHIVNGVETIFSEFEIDGFQFEIFCQNIPTKQQNAYRHMIIEYQILFEKGESFKNDIINLKKFGLKTEPAFAKLLNITGNPYIELLNYYKN